VNRTWTRHDIDQKRNNIWLLRVEMVFHRHVLIVRWVEPWDGMMDKRGGGKSGIERNPNLTNPNPNQPQPNQLMNGVLTWDGMGDGMMDK
jgi:hypothetical protein